jgi:hypothetical protein
MGEKGEATLGKSFSERFGSGGRLKHRIVDDSGG